MALNELSIFLKKNRQHRLSDQLGGRIAELSGAKSVNRQHCPDWTDHEIHYRVVFEYFPPLLLTLSQRVRGAVALGNEKGRQPAYRGTDRCFNADAASLRLAETLQEEGQQCETDAPVTGQHGASRAAG